MSLLPASGVYGLTGHRHIQVSIMPVMSCNVSSFTPMRHPWHVAMFRNTQHAKNTMLWPSEGGIVMLHLTYPTSKCIFSTPNVLITVCVFMTFWLNDQSLYLDLHITKYMFCCKTATFLGIKSEELFFPVHSGPAWFCFLYASGKKNVHVMQP